MLYCNMTFEQTFKAVTRNAAKAVNRESEIGLIKEDYNADILFWDIDSIYEIPYWFNSDRIIKIIKNGKLISL